MVKSMKAAILFGIAMAAIGTVVGLLPVATETASGCGSVFFPSDMYFDAMTAGTTCPEGVAARAPFAWVPLAAGALLALGAAVALWSGGRGRGQDGRRAAPPPP